MNAQKRTLYLVLLTLALLLIAAVPAWAAPALTVNPNTVNTNQTEEFALDVTGLSTAINGQTITVTFPNGFSTADTNAVVTAISGNQPYIFGVTWTNPTNPVTFVMPSNAVPGDVTRLTITGLTMQAPASAGSGQVTVTIGSGANAVTVSAPLTVQEAATSVAITAPTSPVAAGQNFNVAGNINPALDGRQVSVTIRDNSNAIVASKTAVTTAGSFVAGPFALTRPGNYTIRAVCDNVVASQPLTVNPAAPKKLVFTTTPGRLLRGQPGTFIVQRQDEYGNPVTSGDTVVFLSAVNASGQPAGSFTSNAATVSSVTITAGTDSAPFVFAPSIAGQITITASASGLSSATRQYEVPAPPTSIQLTLTPAATDATGRALPGTRITATLTTDVPADTDYTVTVGLTFSSGTDWATVQGPVTLSNGQRQATFTITTTTNAAANNSLTVQASFTPSGATDPLGATASVAFGPAPSVAPQFTRSLNPGWQVISVPVKLNKSLVDLFGGADKFEALYLYDAATASWKDYSKMTSEEQYGKPLVGYLVKMKQAIDARADYLRVPGTQAVPPALPLKQGWNLVGASADSYTSHMLASVSGRFSTVVNPGLGNRATTWGALTSPTPWVLPEEPVYVGDAYWVFMTADGTLAGLMVPPVQ